MSAGLVPGMPSGTDKPSSSKCLIQYSGRFPSASRQFIGFDGKIPPKATCQKVSMLVDKIQRNTLCPVSVPVLTKKSATYLRKLLILIAFRTSAERARFELADRFPHRQFSKLLVSATHPPLRVSSLKSAAKIHFFPQVAIHRKIFLSISAQRLSATCYPLNFVSLRPKNRTYEIHCRTNRGTTFRRGNWRP